MEQDHAAQMPPVTRQMLDELLASGARFSQNPDFICRKVAGNYMLVPVGGAGVFENSMLQLNETCAFLWEQFSAPRYRRRSRCGSAAAVRRAPGRY